MNKQSTEAEKEKEKEVKGLMKSLYHFFLSHVGLMKKQSVVAVAGDKYACPAKFNWMQHLPDSDTVALVVSASKVSGLELATVLQVFGEYFICQFVIDEGFNKLLESMGDSLFQFLTKVDSLHWYMEKCTSNHHFPVIWVNEENPDDNPTEIIVHYKSIRGDLLIPCFKGILLGLAKDRFNCTIGIADQPSEGEHATFKMSFEGPVCPEKGPGQFKPPPGTMKHANSKSRSEMVSTQGLRLLLKLDRTIARDFQTFLQKKLCEENILYLYKSFDFQDASTKEDRKKVADEIMIDYVAEGCANEVNISGPARNRIIKEYAEFTDDVPTTFFAYIDDQVLQMILPFYVESEALQKKTAACN